MDTGGEADDGASGDVGAMTPPPTDVTGSPVPDGGSLAAVAAVLLGLAAVALALAQAGRPGRRPRH